MATPEGALAARQAASGYARYGQSELRRKLVAGLELAGGQMAPEQAAINGPAAAKT